MLVLCYVVRKSWDSLFVTPFDRNIIIPIMFRRHQQLYCRFHASRLNGPGHNLWSVIGQDACRYFNVRHPTNDEDSCSFGYRPLCCRCDFRKIWKKVPHRQVNLVADYLFANETRLPTATNSSGPFDVNRSTSFNLWFIRQFLKHFYSLVLWLPHQSPFVNVRIPAAFRFTYVLRLSASP